MLHKQTSIDIDDNENITTSPNPLHHRALPSTPVLPLDQHGIDDTVNVNNNNNPMLSCNVEQKPTYTVTDTDSESNKFGSKHSLLIGMLITVFLFVCFIIFWWIFSKLLNISQKSK